MNEPARRGKRLALRFALTQVACAGLVALVCLGTSGLNSARSALAGGLIVASGTLLFGWRLFASSWPPAAAARGFYLGELVKWLWIGGALWLAFTVGGFLPLPLVLGVVAGQIGFWVAVGLIK
jgi:F0F1-type ATP synthase assembly protein I